MGLACDKKSARLSEVISVEDAETLLEWLLKHPKGSVDLGHCTHLHTAVMQVLMAARPKISVWPADGPLQQTLRLSLGPDA